MSPKKEEKETNNVELSAAFPCFWASRRPVAAQIHRHMPRLLGTGFSCPRPQAAALHFLIGLTALAVVLLLPEDGRAPGPGRPSNKPHGKGSRHGCAS